MARITRRQDAIRPAPVEDDEEEEVEVVYRQTARPGEEPMPDMRLASNRLLFLKDPTKTMSGERDMRRIENRPDLQKRRHTKLANMKNLPHDEE